MLFENSKILRYQEEKRVSEWIRNGENKKITYTLLYRGSRDGFAAAEFHKRCDGKSPTISFIESLEY